MLKRISVICLSVLMILQLTSTAFAQPVQSTEYSPESWQYLTHFAPTEDRATKLVFTAAESGYYMIGAVSGSEGGKLGAVALSKVYLKLNDKIAIDLAIGSAQIESLGMTATASGTTTGGNVMNVQADKTGSGLSSSPFAKKYSGGTGSRSSYGIPLNSFAPVPGCVIVEREYKTNTYTAGKAVVPDCPMGSQIHDRHATYLLDYYTGRNLVKDGIIYGEYTGFLNTINYIGMGNTSRLFCDGHPNSYIYLSSQGKPLHEISNYSVDDYSEICINNGQISNGPNLYRSHDIVKKYNRYVQEYGTNILYQNMTLSSDGEKKFSSDFLVRNEIFISPQIIEKYNND